MKGVGRFPLMLVSFVLSLILWLYVQVQEDPEGTKNTSFTVPIEVVGLPEGYKVISKPETYTYFPLGNEDEIRKIRAEDLHATLNLSKPKLGASSYPLRLVTDREYDVSWDPKSPPQIMVTIDQIVQNAPKTIEIRARGQLRDPNYEYVPSQTKASPETVYVTGPKSLVDRVDHAEAVLDLSIVRAGDKQAYDSPIQLFSKDGVLIYDDQLKYSPGPVTVTPGLRLAPEIRPVVVNGIVKGTVPFGYKVDRIELIPSQIEIRGKADALNEVSSLDTEPVDISAMTQTQTVRARVSIPSSVAAAGSEYVNVKVVIVPAPLPQPSGPPPSSTPPTTGAKAKSSKLPSNR